MKNEIIVTLIAATTAAAVTLAAGNKTKYVSATAIMQDSTQTSDTDLKTSSESFAESAKKTPTTPNASSEGVSERKGQTDSSDKHSYIGSRARAKALQTDKFPRSPGATAVSGTAQPVQKK